MKEKLQCLQEVSELYWTLDFKLVKFIIIPAIDNKFNYRYQNHENVTAIFFNHYWWYQTSSHVVTGSSVKTNSEV